MKLTPEERANIRQAFGTMSLPQKLDYIWTYYKIPIVAAAAALFFIVSYGGHLLTRKKPLLYLGLANVAAGDEVLDALSDDFVTAQGADPRRSEVSLYTGLYYSDDASSENHEYAYASRLKILAAITDQKLDAVLMNREAYDLFSGNGYLLPLPNLLEQNGVLNDALAPYLCTNTVILSDNAIEVELGEADEYAAETEQAVNAIAGGAFPRLAAAGFSGEVYLGVIGNTPREDMILNWLAWLTEP